MGKTFKETPKNSVIKISNILIQYFKMKINAKTPCEQNIKESSGDSNMQPALGTTALDIEGTCVPSCESQDLNREKDLNQQEAMIRCMVLESSFGC